MQPIRRVFLCSFLLIAMFSGSGEAQTPQDTPVSRWHSPLNTPRVLHALPSHHGPLKLAAAPTMKAMPASENQTGRIALVVHHNLYNAISDNLNLYIEDLALQGYTAHTMLYTEGGPQALRQALYDLYQESESLTGAIFIGDLPFVIYEMMQAWGSDDPEYEDFPCDAYFMDLNGQWADNTTDGDVTPGNGRLDSWTGDQDLEIWVARWKTDRLPMLGQESDLLNQYIVKSLDYRQGRLHPRRQSIVYVDDDWHYGAENDSVNLALIHPDHRPVAVYDPAATTADDYRSNRMHSPAEFMFMRSHGYTRGHGFYDGEGQFSYVMNSNYADVDPQALFYSFFVCSGSDFTVTNNLATLVTFNPANSGLLAWGSAKTGGMLYDRFFYKPLAEGASFGAAFIEWFNQVAKYGDWAAQWFWGMALIGDAALAMETPPPTPPRDLSIKFTDGISTLVWTENSESDMHHYTLYRSVDSEDWAMLASLPQPASEYIDPNIEHDHVYAYRLTATDTDGRISSFSDIVTVEADTSNQPPVISSFSDMAFEEDGRKLLPHSHFYDHIEDPNTADADLILNIQGGQFVSCAHTSSLFTLTAPQNWFGTDTLMLTVSDGQLSDSCRFAVTVLPVNDAPLFNPRFPQDVYFTPARPCTVDIAASIIDVDNDFRDMNLSCRWLTPDNGFEADLSDSGLLIIRSPYNIAATRGLTLQIDDGQLSAETSLTVHSERCDDLYAVAGGAPEKFELKPTYPNPFNSSTNIYYSLTESADVSITLYDSRGRLCSVVLEQWQQAGSYNLPLHAARLSSGVYILKLTARGEKTRHAYRKIILSQ